HRGACLQVPQPDRSGRPTVAQRKAVGRERRGLVHDNGTVGNVTQDGERHGPPAVGAVRQATMPLPPWRAAPSLLFVLARGWEATETTYPQVRRGDGPCCLCGSSRTGAPGGPGAASVARSVWRPRGAATGDGAA